VFIAWVAEDGAPWVVSEYEDGDLPPVDGSDRRNGGTPPGYPPLATSVSAALNVCVFWVTAASY
jgi:hypothetical protein